MKEKPGRGLMIVLLMMSNNLIGPNIAKTWNGSGNEHIEHFQRSNCTADAEPTVSRIRFPFRHISHVAMKRLEAISWQKSCQWSTSDGRAASAPLQTEELQVLHFRLKNVEVDRGLCTGPAEERIIRCFLVTEHQGIIISLANYFGFCLPNFSSLCSLFPFLVCNIPRPKTVISKSM